MSFEVVIPARYESTRLPGKVLLEIGGKPMLQHVWQHAVHSGAQRVVIATDDVRVFEAASGWGAQVAMTASTHRSGTERTAEIIEQLAVPPERIVVNVQGDEPLMPGSLIRQVADDLSDYPECSVATLCEPILTRETLFDPNAVKVVRDARGFALYFTRATVPWYRDLFARADDRREPQPLHFRHIGMYAYRAGYVARYVGMRPSELEAAESLEQLRVLHAGDKIHVAVALEDPGPGVDTPADLERARALFQQG